MSYKLDKPCDDDTRTEFIFKYGQDCYQEGYKCHIEETDKAVYALEVNEMLDGDEVVINPDYEKIHLQEVKQDKINENDTARDTALNQGVEYNNVLFDSDTDQKINLLATVSTMDDTETIEWFGMNNDSLICTKQDLLNIGGLIAQLHSYCWNKNAQIKEQIGKADTVEEVEGVEIDYEI